MTRLLNYLRAHQSALILAALFTMMALFAVAHTWFAFYMDRVLSREVRTVDQRVTLLEEFVRLRSAAAQDILISIDRNHREEMTYLREHCEGGKR